MSVLYIALPVALILGGAAMLACVACIRRGQFDDLETPAVRILIDERPIYRNSIDAAQGVSDPGDRSGPPNALHHRGQTP